MSKQVATRIAAGLAGVLIFGAVGTGMAQQMKGTQGMAGMGQTTQAASSVEDQLKQLRQELEALREELAELKEARRGQVAMEPGMMGGGPMGPMMPPMMQPMMQMMRACGQMMGMMGQVGGMSGMMPESEPQSLEGREPTEHGSKRAGGLEVTLLTAPPLSPAQMQKFMPGMGGMRQGRQGMKAIMRGRGSMAGMGQAQPTHWIGVIVRDLKDDRVVQNLPISLTVMKGGVIRAVELIPMPGSYGANVSLPEKGRYIVTVTIARSAQPLAVAFELNYKSAG